jgi:hypothetical protein
MLCSSFSICTLSVSGRIVETETASPSESALSFWKGIMGDFGTPRLDITEALDAIERGDQKTADELFPAVYAELRRLAAWKMAGEAPGQTLQATALVHEAAQRGGLEHLV